jgi:hypothetical protein
MYFISIPKSEIPKFPSVGIEASVHYRGALVLCNTRILGVQNPGLT